MLTLEQSFDTSSLLAPAARLLPVWGRDHPALAGLGSVADVVAASRTGSKADRDEVLLALAELASPDGGDSVEATALLCNVLIPAVVSTLLAGLRTDRDLEHGDVTMVVAAHLWIAARTFPWRTHRKVAATIQWRVRRAVLAELGVTHHLARLDRTWAATAPAPDEQLGAMVVAASELPADRELDALLGHAVEVGVIGWCDVELLWALVLESDQLSGRFTTCGLMSASVTELVGVRFGVTGRTVRRRAAKALDALRGMVQGEEPDQWDVAA